MLDRLFVAPAVTGVWAVTDPTNLASCRVLERLGMRLDFEGEFDGKPSRVYRLARDGWRDPRRTTARSSRTLPARRWRAGHAEPVIPELLDD